MDCGIIPKVKCTQLIINSTRKTDASGVDLRKYYGEEENIMEKKKKKHIMYLLGHRPFQDRKLIRRTGYNPPRWLSRVVHV
jgi:hypothetical protein